MSSSPRAGAGGGVLTPEPFTFAQLAPAPPPLPTGELEARAEGLLAAAEAEAEGIRAQAHAAGLAEGRAAGLEEAQAQLHPAAAALAEALAQVDELRAELAERLEHEAAELAVRIAEKVVAGRLEAEPGRVVDVVRGALRCLVERERVVVLVHPGDLELVREAAGELTTTLGGIEHLEVQEERRVPRGSALVRSQAGEVDARIETKLARVRELFARAAAEPEPGHAAGA